MEVQLFVQGASAQGSIFGLNFFGNFAPKLIFADHGKQNILWQLLWLC